MANSSSVPLIFIHGIKGSSIVDAKGWTMYINLWQGLGLSSPQLSLPMDWKDGKQTEDGLRPGEIFSKIGHVSVYGPFLNYLQTLGRPVYPYAYDWRRDLNESVEKFQAFIRSIYKKHNSKVQLIAHSMGGLVTLASINTHHGVLVGDPVAPTTDRDNVPPRSGDPETATTRAEAKFTPSSTPGDERIIDIVQSVLYAGCPFRTGVGFLKDLMVGVPNGYNYKILSPSVLFTFPSIYTFFPKKENSQILDVNGNPIPIDFYQGKDWIDYKLGIFDQLENPSKEHIEHLDNCTAQAKLLRSKIVALNVKYPPGAVLASHKHVTVQKYKLINGELNFDDPITAMGDDRIINATPPDGVPYKEYETDLGHAGLLNDIPVVSKIISDLVAAC